MDTYKTVILCILYFTSFCDSEDGHHSRSRPILILEKMKTDKSLCAFPSKDLYNLELLTICDRPLLDNHKQINEYLRYDFVPLLCMALYDVSLRLCELTNAHSELKTYIPQTEDSFKALIEMFEGSKKYSNINQFCSTVNGSLLDRSNSSYETARWINYFNQLLKDEQNCERVCQQRGLLNVPDKVHPVCSFIIWSNSLYTGALTSDLSTKNHEVEKFDEKNANEQTGLQPPLNIADVNNQSEQKNNPKINIHDQDLQSNGQENAPELSEKSLESVPNSGSNNIDPSQSTVKPVVMKDNADEHKLEKTKQPQQSEAEIADHLKNPQGIINGNLSHESKTDDEMKLDKPNSLLQNNLTPSHQNPAGGNNSEKKVENDLKIEQSKSTSDTGVQSSNPMTVPTALPQSAKKDPEQQVADPQVPEQKEGNNIAPPEEQAGDPVKDGKNSFPEEEREFIPDSSNNEDPTKINNEENQAVQDPSLLQDEDDPNPAKENEPPKLQNEEQIKDKDEYIERDDHFVEAEDSHFFTNFVSLAVLCIIAYLVFHNKKKLLALAVEGKRRGPTRRRPNTASYSKLDCNLEEAMVSNTTASVTHVLY